MLQFIFRLFIVPALFFTFNAPAAWCKPPPLSGIFQMFDAFNDLESEFRSEEWEAAEQTILGIQAYYSRLSHELKKGIDNKTVHKFGFLITRLKNKIETRELEAVDDTYMKLQSLFLEIMDQYDYPVPPAIIIYNRYIDEALEGLARGDFLEAAEEMKELVELRDHGDKALEQKAVSTAERNTFFATIENAEKAARDKNPLATKEHLQKLKLFINNYLPNP